MLILACPRLISFIIFVFTNWWGQAYETVIWPILGFIFLPWTSLVYMAAMLHNNHQVTGWWVVLMVIAVLSDLGSAGSATEFREKN